jgi:hypothetical protein
MKNIFKVTFLILGIAVLNANADVSVNVNGTQYQCTAGGGGGGGGGGNGVNYCRCRSWTVSSSDTDYALEKYNPSTQQYRELQRFTLGSGQDATDRQNCIDAKEDPACFFTDSRFLQLVPTHEESDLK